MNRQAQVLDAPAHAPDGHAHRVAGPEAHSGLNCRFRGSAERQIADSPLEPAGWAEVAKNMPGAAVIEREALDQHFLVRDVDRGERCLVARVSTAPEDCSSAMDRYANWATSGGEGAALSYERDQFRAALVREFGYDPTETQRMNLNTHTL